MSNLTSVTEGRIPFTVSEAGKDCSTWYKLFGSLSSISPTSPPLIVLHGGPGGSHNYLLSLVDLYEIHGIPIIFYDQLGGGNSTHLPEKLGDVNFWTESLFLDELENLLAHFGLGGADGKPFNLLGSSWGGMFGSRFAASARPRAINLRRLVLADTPSSSARWIASAKQQISTLPEDVQAALKKHEEDGTTDSEEYKAAMEVFTKNFTCRVQPMPPAVLETYKILEEDPTVYLTMYVESFDVIQRTDLCRRVGMVRTSSTSPAR